MDGVDERNNLPAQRGRKLRHQGSNPTGDQTLSFMPEYSDEMDYDIGATTLNDRPKMSENQYLNRSEKSKCSREMCKRTGLVIKEPLS